VILDRSAVIAIMLREPGAEGLVGKLARAQGAGVGAPTLAETGLVLTVKVGRRGREMLARFVHEAGIVIVPFGEEHWRVAVDAYGRFGRGRHPAALNFGDCLTYATARLADQPLLCVGDDFAKTDLRLA
jgi:ribonuclease VapC